MQLKYSCRILKYLVTAFIFTFHFQVEFLIKNARYLSQAVTADTVAVANLKNSVIEELKNCEVCDADLSHIVHADKSWNSLTYVYGLVYADQLLGFLTLMQC